MMKRITIILFLISLTEIVSVIQSKVFTIQDNETERMITVRKNQRFYIKLNGNPTTGYVWSVANVDEISSAIKPMNLNEHNGTDNLQPLSNNPNMVGSGSSYFFLFKTQSPRFFGSPIDIKFVYKRPWMDSEDDIIKTIHAMILY